ncbi:MAG: hypothetical protein ABEI31_03070 [Halodesulfurarchaeum sp.]
MPRKTMENIERWVEAALRETLGGSISGSDSLTATYERNAGHYERVRVEAPGLEIPPDERFSAEIEGMTVEFQALETDGSDGHLLRVKVS